MEELEAHEPTIGIGPDLQGEPRPADAAPEPKFDREDRMAPDGRA